MSQPTKQVLRYLNEAHAGELGLVSVLESQIELAPRGSYRTGLERHLRETRDHAMRLQARMSDLGQGGNGFLAGLGVAGSAIVRGLSLGKAPFGLLRGSGGDEKVLKDARDACAIEAFEIATYTAIEQLARSAGDETTARLAASIRADEEKMLALILGEIPKLTDAVAGPGVKTAAKQGTTNVKRTREPWPGYDELTVEEIRAALAKGDDARAKTARRYERAHKNRAGVLTTTERELSNA